MTLRCAQLRHLGAGEYEDRHKAVCMSMPCFDQARHYANQHRFPTGSPTMKVGCLIVIGSGDRVTTMGVTVGSAVRVFFSEVKHKTKGQQSEYALGR